MDSSDYPLAKGAVVDVAPVHSIGKLALALAKAQSVMGGASKDGKNPHFGSKYATLASVWDACREPLTAQGIAVVQIPQADGAKVSLTTVLVHESGEQMQGTITATAKDASPQSVGSAITYLRRYSLAAMVGICPEDDDGQGAQPTKPEPRRTSQEHVERVAAAVTKAKPVASTGPATQAILDAPLKTTAELFEGDDLPPEMGGTGKTETEHRLKATLFLTQLAKIKNAEEAKAWRDKHRSEVHALPKQLQKAVVGSFKAVEKSFEEHQEHA